jgi:hypothetical protein
VWARPALVRVLAHSCLIKSANTETETVNPQISPMDEGVVRYSMEERHELLVKALAKV